MAVKAILAVDRCNGGIGYQNKLPWSLPCDLKRFKQLTWGQTIVMGVSTAQSLKKPLPGRNNIVITRTATFNMRADLVALRDAGFDIRHADELIGASLADWAVDGGDVWVIGGVGLYDNYGDHITEWHVTLVEAPRKTRYDAYVDEFLHRRLVDRSTLGDSSNLDPFTEYRIWTPAND